MDWERGEFARGASTITQQLAKNLYLSPSKNPLRKVRELLITRRLEAELSKQRILEILSECDRVGRRRVGRGGGVAPYFHKCAAELSAAESALLARGAIATRTSWIPVHPEPPSARRQAMIMRRMGAVTPPPVVADRSGRRRRRNPFRACHLTPSRRSRRCPAPPTADAIRSWICAVISRQMRP